MQELIHILLGFRVLASLTVLVLFAILFYHCIVYRKCRALKQVNETYRKMCSMYGEELATAQAEVQRLRTKLNSAKSRIRRQRKASRRRKHRDVS